MKKSIIISGIFLCLFILMSLSYQSVVAIDIKNNLLISAIPEEDCECNDNGKNLPYFPRPLCDFLTNVLVFLIGYIPYFLYTHIQSEYFFWLVSYLFVKPIILPLAIIIAGLGIFLNCPDFIFVP